MSFIHFTGSLTETLTQYRPVRLNGIELADPSDTKHPSLNLDVPTSEPALAHVLAEHLSPTSPADTDIDPTVLKLDRNHEYSIWLSYAEVYNEKAYDLLESVNNIEHEKEMQQPTTKSGLPRPAPHNSHPQSQSHPLLLTRKALPVKPSPASDTGTATSSGKYIAGLRQFRVHSAAQAKRLLKLGQLHRRVFGTLANSQSSRSHGLVTIKVVRGHRGERNVCTLFSRIGWTLRFVCFFGRTRQLCRFLVCLWSIWLVLSGPSTRIPLGTASKKRAALTNPSWSSVNAWRYVRATHPDLIFIYLFLLGQSGHASQSKTSRAELG